MMLMELTKRRYASFLVVRKRSINMLCTVSLFFFFQAEDGIRDLTVTGVQTCALPILDSVDESKIRRAADFYAALDKVLAAIGPARDRIQIFISSRISEWQPVTDRQRSEEHTSELQSQSNLVCRLLLEKQKLASSPRLP